VIDVYEAGESEREKRSKALIMAKIQPSKVSFPVLLLESGVQSSTPDNGPRATAPIVDPKA
jgi:hypothetical protein